MKTEACTAFGADDAHPSRAAADAMVFTVAALQARLFAPPAPARRTAPLTVPHCALRPLDPNMSASCCAHQRGSCARGGVALGAHARDALRDALRDGNGQLRVLGTPAWAACCGAEVEDPTATRQEARQPFP